MVLTTHPHIGIAAKRWREYHHLKNHLRRQGLLLLLLLLPLSLTPLLLLLPSLIPLHLLLPCSLRNKRNIKSKGGLEVEITAPFFHAIFLTLSSFLSFAPTLTPIQTPPYRFLWRNPLALTVTKIVSTCASNAICKKFNVCFFSLWYCPKEPKRLKNID